MVDFNKKVHNTDKFRLAAIHFQKYGVYTTAPVGTTDYRKYWDQESDRCLNGYVAPDGDAITGYHYFYLNYFPIMNLKEVEYTDRFGHIRKRRERIFAFPDFYDYDYYYFNAVEEAEDCGKHMAVLKARAKGYSFKGASMLVRNYFLIKGSKNFAVASEARYLTGDGLLTKAWQGMDFIDRNTAWAKQRLVSTRLERTSGFKIKDEFGKETEDGYLSSITGITLKNDPERIRGTRGRLILWEEAGKFPDIKQAWAVEQPAVETDDGKAFGLMIAYGTGGSEGADFEGLKDMFYHPDGFNILSFDNIWDEKAEDTKCAFFVPSWANIDSVDENGKRIYMDEDGNSLREKSILLQIELRNKVRDGLTDLTFTDRYVAEHPLTPQESMLEIGGNIFPKKLLLQQLSRIRTNKKLLSMKHIVDLVWDGNGGVTAIEKKQGDITEYPLPKDKKPDGSIVIWEYPIKDPPFGLYIGGCLTPGEKVLTQRGLVSVEEVDIEDSLLNKDGDQVLIKNILLRNKVDEDTYRIKPSCSYRTTTFTSEHPIWTGNRGFVKASELTCSDWLEIPNVYHSYFGDHKHCQTIDKEKKLAYFYGLFTGDGFTNINGNSYDVYLSIGRDEKEFAEFYDKLVLDLFNRQCIHVHKNKELTRRFTSKALVEELNLTVGTTAYNKRVPNWIKNGSYGIKLAFLQGFLDSDGSVLKDRNKIRINFTSVNLELLEDILDLLFGLEIKNSIVIHQKEHTSKHGIHSLLSYRINIAIEDNSKLTFDPVYESRKIKLAKLSKASGKSKMNIIFIGKTIWLKVEKIDKSCYTGVVYNFECYTHTFGCRCIMTHNCDPLTQQSSGFKIEQKR